MEQNKHSSFGGFLDGGSAIYEQNQRFVEDRLADSISLLVVLTGEYRAEAQAAGMDIAAMKLERCKEATRIDASDPINSLTSYGRSLAEAITSYLKSGSSNKDRHREMFHELVFIYIEIARTLEVESMMDAAIELDEALGT